MSLFSRIKRLWELSGDNTVIHKFVPEQWEELTPTDFTLDSDITPIGKPSGRATIVKDDVVIDDEIKDENV